MTFTLSFTFTMGMQIFWIGVTIRLVTTIIYLKKIIISPILHLISTLCTITYMVHQQSSYNISEFISNAKLSHLDLQQFKIHIKRDIRKAWKAQVCVHPPSGKSGWQSCKSLQVRAGLLLVPSGCFICSISCLRELSEPKISSIPSS